MTRCQSYVGLVACAAALFACQAAWGEVTRVEIKSRTPYAEGREFSGVGKYEVLRGKAYFAVSPQSDANRSVCDLELAPRNAKGMVEFSTDLEILAPVDLAKANGSALYDVNNRGNKLSLGQFNTGADEFLMRHGWICLWSGWIAETQPGGGRLRLTAPIATNQGEPITGLVRSEVIVDAPAASWTMSQWANQGCYEPTKKGEQEAVLTWRQREKDPRVVIPRSQWHFEKSTVTADGEQGQLPTLALAVAGGLHPGYIYEVVYEAQGPIVQGLGFVGMRDLISYLKYDTTERNPLRLPTGKSAVQVAHAFGVSQSGRAIRHFLYEGFNADEQGRQVFDGLMPHVAGAGLGSFNHRFALPTRTNGQHDNHHYPADVFPFTYGDETDPLTGKVDGILRRSRVTKTTPKVFHTQSSSEYWHRSGSLVHTDPMGKRDAEIPPEVRLYTYGGTQHGAGSGTPAASADQGQLIINPADYRPLNRALLVALDNWVRRGVEPPASVYPKIADGTLVPWQAPQSGWNPVPGVRYPEVIQQPELWDRGSEAGQGRFSIEPPLSRGTYVVKVPGFRSDNNERGTLDLPMLTVPVATFTSWNTRSRSLGAEGELLSLMGGYIPFVKTKEEREKLGDPRPALLERYTSFADYQAKVLTAAKEMVAKRYLLEEELAAVKKGTESQRKLFD